MSSVGETSANNKIGGRNVG